MTVSASFFGTDGIRGSVSLETVDEEESIRLIEHERTLTPAFMRLVGEALSYTRPALPGEGEVVVVGWDRRPGNTALVAALTLGLRLTGSHVIHIGECATPTLHRAVLAFGARAGCMITASHNPVADSGIKVFDSFGYKSNRAYETDVSQTVRQLAEEDRDVDAVDREALALPDEAPPDWSKGAHRTWLAQRWSQFERVFGVWNGGTSDRFASPLLIDGANGFGASWLAEFLRERGVNCREVSSPSGVLNEGCGAGDLSPTATWTHQEVEASSHMLLKALKPAPEGQLVGAALDGDGDRCLFIQATGTGFAVVDGDAMAAMLLGAAADRPWSFAASIESDVALFGHVQSLNAETECIETAVGDRWLSYALRPSEGGWLHDATMPASCGIEDSGHVVLPAPHPTVDDAWSLVGDGAATLCAVLLAAAQPTVAVFDRGWKKRVSIKDSHRERWQASSELFSSTEENLRTTLERLGFEAQRRRIEGEPDLLLMHGHSREGVASFGIRNSGTQAKTSLSVRLSKDLDPSPFEKLLDTVTADLAAVLTAD